MEKYKLVEKSLRAVSDKKIAEHSSRFFKTGKGEYGEGDKFLGIRVPVQRNIAIKYQDLPLDDISILLESEYHEIRLTALFILVGKYRKADIPGKENIYRFYMSRLVAVNNWDLVDSSAKYIAGHYLFGKDKTELYKMAISDNLWERRISIIATHYFIDQGYLHDTFHIAEQLLHDSEDLIHKATGWMLREAGKKDKPSLISFLKKYYSDMPRTMLRYAIEKFDSDERTMILNGNWL
jgi:3-methyladenine DNA glycosylase AlkD